VAQGRVTTATVLFCDLVGSTAQRTALGDDAADRLTAALDRMLRDAVGDHHGSVIKGTGDGIMAVFAATNDALSAAEAAHQAAERHNREATDLEQLVLRAGVSAGDVHFVAGDCYGTAVVEAARLEAAAEPGTILVSGLARAVVGSRGGHSFERVGMLELKGLPEPVEAFRAHWAPPPSAGTIAVPWQVKLAPSSGVVGRAPERDAIRRAAKATADGEGRRVLLVGGEAGVGKTTLVAEAARAAHDDGMTVLYGGCDEDVTVPYRPFVEALRHFVVNAADDWLASFDPQRLSELARLVPELNDRCPNLPPPRATDPDGDRYLLFGAVASLLAEASRIEPLVLILEDLHWADRPTLHLLRHVVSVPLGRVLVIGTYRDVELSPTHPLTEALGALVREPGLERLTVVGFDRGGVVELLEAAAGHELDDAGDELALLLWRETDGNPFFVSEILRHLSETGVLVQDPAGQWRSTTTLTEVGLPDTVRAVVRARAARLDDKAIGVLRAAAVIGRNFELDLLSSVTGEDANRLLDVVESAEQLALVTEAPDVTGRFGFRHALVQQAFYQDLGHTRRRTLHLQVADAIDGSYAQADERAAEVAQHLVAADDLADGDRTREACRRAGEHALEMLAPDEAVRWFTQALTLARSRAQVDDVALAALHVSLGDAQRQAGDPSFRETLLEAARLARAGPSGDALVVAAAIANNRGFASVSGAVDPERRAVLEAALEAVGPAESDDRAQVLALLAAELTYEAGDGERRLQLAHEARSLARKRDDPATVLHVMNVTYHASWTLDSFAERLANTAEAVRLAECVGDPVAGFWAALWRSFVALELGDPVETLKRRDQVRAFAEEVGQPTLLWLSLFSEAMWQMVQGWAEESERLATEALQLGTDTGQPDAAAIFGAQLIGVRWHQGRLDEVVDLVAEVSATNPGIPGFRAAHAHCLVEAGRREDARRLLDAELAAGFEHPNDLILSTYVILWSEAANHLGHEQAARMLLPLVAPHVDRVSHNGTSAQGAFAHSAGILAATIGDLDTAESHLGTAVRIHETLGAPFFTARTKLELGRVLQRRSKTGDQVQSMLLLGESLELAERHGCAFVASRARTALEGMR
jgi:class 3 adenylate cyclase/energy-coupling factor transporter ATP-binding protein EcfA2